MLAVGLVSLSHVLTDFDGEFNGRLNDDNLVSRTDAAAAFTILALVMTVSSLVQLIFGLGRIGFSAQIQRATWMLAGSGTHVVRQCNLCYSCVWSDCHVHHG